VDIRRKDTDDGAYMTIVLILMYSCLISAFITFGLGIYVSAKNPESHIGRIFLAAMIAATYWAIGEFFIWQSVHYEGVLFWLKFSSLWPFIAVLAAHFILVCTDHPLADKVQQKRLFILLYLPAIFFTVLEIFTDEIYVVVYQSGRWLYMPVLTGPYYLLESLFIVAIMIWSLYLIVRAWKASPHGRIRRQNRLVSMGLLSAIGFGIISGFFLPILGMSTPNFIFIGIVVFSILITYAIHTYGLFTLTPKTAVLDILRTMPDGMILSDNGGMIITSNQAADEIFDASGNLSGRSLHEILPADICTMVRTEEERGERISDLEVDLEGDDGKVISIAASEVKTPEGESAGCVLIIRDITKRKVSERALRIASEKIARLTQLTRHDIGNLVTALDGYLELLKDEPDGPTSERYLDQSIDIVEKIFRHLEFSREYQGVGAYEPIWISLQRTVMQAIDDISHENVRIQSEVLDVVIYVDRLFVRVIYNLLDNAIRHGECITTIRIRSEEAHDGSLTIIVEDDGIGIPDDEKERIFNYGYGKNTGFGLAFARDVALVTGITLIETGTQGKGARFEMRLPRSGWKHLKS
jgi:PAS domain S-box-containing protein